MRRGRGEMQLLLHCRHYPRQAHAQEQCAHDHPAPSGSSTYGSDYTACIQDPAQQRQTVNDRDYTFSVPAPPKPSASAAPPSAPNSASSPGGKRNPTGNRQINPSYRAVPTTGLGVVGFAIRRTSCSRKPPSWQT